ncbi:hypothetical protein D3C80_1060150 [compost metagenome]
MDLLVSLVDFDVQAPVVGHFLYGGIEDVADLRVCRREVALVNLWELPHSLTDAAATHPSLPRPKPGHVSFELVGHSKEAGLRDVKCRADPHRLPSRPLR